ncbi:MULTISPECIES: hypothetical protein [unclassified Microcoleus]|uniref:hypothetical protein n=1 Tax=unclassified Microcoleus TaxID=2642155 RepID=UPI002FD332CD
MRRPQQSLPQARSGIVYFALQNGRSTGRYKSLDGRANPPETVLNSYIFSRKIKKSAENPGSSPAAGIKKIKN